MKNLLRPFVRQLLLAPAVIGAILCLMPAMAYADCVDYSKARAKKAAEEMRRNPPSLAKLGLPEIADLTIDAERSSGDPVCDKPEKRRHFFFRTRMSILDFYTAMFPYIQPNSNWTNPAGGNSHKLYLTSGAIVKFDCNSQYRLCKSLPIDQPDQILEVAVEWPISQTPNPLTGDGPGWNWTPRDLAEERGIPAAGKADSYGGSRAKSNPVSSASNKPSDDAGCGNANAAASDCASDQSASSKGAAAAKIAKSVFGGLLGSKRIPTDAVPAPSSNCKP
jgi:hypothetical protein